MSLGIGTHVGRRMRSAHAINGGDQVSKNLIKHARTSKRLIKSCCIKSPRSGFSDYAGKQ